MFVKIDLINRTDGGVLQVLLLAVMGAMRNRNPSPMERLGLSVLKKFCVPKSACVLV